MNPGLFPAPIPDSMPPAMDALPPVSPALPPGVDRLVDLALSEDLGRGDVTSEAIFSEETMSGELVAREQLVVSGLAVATRVFERLGGHFESLSRDGAHLEVGAPLARVSGTARAVLGAERTALNFLQRLCGVATLARLFADAVAGTSTRVVDTRKTTPGYRWLEKRAVVDGGMHNHRADLASGILIKDNHIAAAGSIALAIGRVREHAPHGLRIEVEVDSLEQMREAIAARAEVILLDNMSVDEVSKAADEAHAAGVIVEVSGGVNLNTVRGYAEAGADVISVGAVTHSAPAVDIALDL